jgi:hypothetical protein
MGMGGILTAFAVVLALVLGGVARADDWWPHPADGSWTYSWTDSVYNPRPTTEKVVVREQSGTAFTLTWTTRGQGNDPAAPISFGDIKFQETTAGIVNTDWTSNLPPPNFPILCPQIAGCNNSLAGTLYYLIWGSRSPVLPAPLLRGMAWAGTGGAGNDVASTSTYQGTEMVKVPAFPAAVLAAKVRTETTQAGALGDPYGSGVRTVWWVFGVGPVKMVFQHSGGADAPVTTSELTATSLVTEPKPSDVNYFPLTKGLKLKYRWTNTKWMRQPSIERATIDEVVNNSGRFIFRHVSGPIRVAGSYGFSTRADGVTNLFGVTKAATSIKFPPLGPRTRRRHFVTPFDLMTFGFNPVLTEYPAPGQTWGSKNPSRDFSTFGVNGSARVFGIQKVKVPAGTFNALAIRATLKQPGFTFGSGTRTSWFAPGKGLVKLVFRHGDGSVSTVVLVK